MTKAVCVPAICLWVTLNLSGCSDSPGHVTMRVSLPESLSDPQGELLFTPFDLPRIIDSLTAEAPFAKPDFLGLQAELIDFRAARSEELDSLQAEWFSVRREIVQLADSLRMVGRDAPGYAVSYDRLRVLHLQVTSRETTLERRMSQLVPSDRIDLARRAMAAADSLRAWESTALVALPNLLDSLSDDLGPIEIAQLPPDGELARELANHPWWVAMRIPHPENPFLEYYWETSFTPNPWIPIVVPMDQRHMTLRWRH